MTDVPATFILGKNLIVMSTVGRICANEELCSISIFNHYEKQMVYETFDNVESFKRAVREIYEVFEEAIFSRIKV